MKKKDADPFGLINAEDFFFRGQGPGSDLGVFVVSNRWLVGGLPEKVLGLDFFLLYYMKNMYGLEIVEYNFIPGRVRA